MNPRVCVRAHHREQSSLRQLFELLRAAHLPRCQTSRMSCSAIGEQQEQQEATRRSRSRCTPPYGWLRLMHRLSSSAATVATDGQSDGHPAQSEALGCPRDGWGGCGHRYKLIIRRTRKVKLANRAARALSRRGLDRHRVVQTDMRFKGGSNRSKPQRFKPKSSGLDHASWFRPQKTVLN